MNKKQMSEAIILAGGFRTRLREVISDVPKPMAPICGKPFLEYLLQSLSNQAINHFVLSTIRVWMESWFFLQKTEMRKLEHCEQLLLKERNYTYGILERLLRFRKSNVFLNSVPPGLSVMAQQGGN